MPFSDACGAWSHPSPPVQVYFYAADSSLFSPFQAWGASGWNGPQGNGGHRGCLGGPSARSPGAWLSEVLWFQVPVTLAEVSESPRGPVWPKGRGHSPACKRMTRLCSQLVRVCLQVDTALADVPALTVAHASSLGFDLGW